MCLKYSMKKEIAKGFSVNYKRNHDSFKEEFSIATFE